MTCCKKVIITGASGLIGKEAVRFLLDAGFEVYALTIDAQNADNGAHWVSCNLFDQKQLQKVFEEIKPQYLLNFAWAVTGDYSTSNVNFDFLTAGLNLLKYFKQNGGQRAVFAGTCFEYGIKEGILKESDSKIPQTIYGKCKNYLRELAELFCTQNEISFSWGRIFYVYGKSEAPNRLTQSILDALRSGKKIEVKHSGLIKDYIYTKDVAAAFVALLGSSVQGEVNVCTSQPITLGEYATTIAQKLGRTDLLVLQDLPSNQPQRIVGDNTRLTREVGFVPKYNLPAALGEILAD